jgi:hypothetical protein
VIDEFGRFPKNQEVKSLERDVAKLRARGDDLRFHVKHMRVRVSGGPWWVIATYVDRGTGVPQDVTLKRCDTAKMANRIVAVLRQHEVERAADSGE